MDTDDFEDPAASAPPADLDSPGRSQLLIAQGGEAVRKCAELTGKDVFEHALLYCLKLLDQSNTGLCAFYIDDFDGFDEYSFGVIQKLITRDGYTTSDFRPPPDNAYKGFWAWKAKKEAASAATGA